MVLYLIFYRSTLHSKGVGCKVEYRVQPQPKLFLSLCPSSEFSPFLKCGNYSFIPPHSPLYFRHLLSPFPFIPPYPFYIVHSPSYLVHLPSSRILSLPLPLPLYHFISPRIVSRNQKANSNILYGPPLSLSSLRQPTPTKVR